MNASALCMTIAASLLAGAMLAAAPADARGLRKNPDVPKGFLAKTVKVNGKDVKYVVYVPPTYDPKTATPTIVSLNGMGECGTDGFKHVAVGLGPAVMLDVDKWPFIIVFPQKQDPGSKWEDDAQQAIVMAALDATERELNVDQSRLYLTGLSQGGHGTWAIAAQHPDMFAAIAPICGWGTKEMAEKLVKVPVWVFHGEEDDTVNVNEARAMVAYLKAAGASCKFTTYPGVGHNSWDKAYREENLYEWFLAHRK